MEKQTTRTYNIPAEATLEVIGGKWKLLILCHLNCGPGPMRTSELKGDSRDYAKNVNSAASGVGGRRHHHENGI